MVYMFEAVDNPHPETLAAVNPTLVIPAGYQGLNRDPWLAQIFNHLIVTGVHADLATLINQPNQNTYPGARLDDVDGFLTVANRYGVEHPEFLYFNFAHVLNMADHSNWYYVIFLAVYYRERVITLATTLMQLIDAEADDAAQIGLDRINNFIDTNTYLRREGIVLPLKELYAFSKQWTKEDAYQLLSHNIHLAEANKYAKAGFVDAATIVRSKHIIPPSMIDDLINPKPLPQTDDDDGF